MKVSLTLQQDKEFRQQGWAQMTLEQAIVFGYEPTLVSWANGMASRDFLPQGYPYAKVQDIPKKYLDRMGIIATTPEKAFEVR